MNDMRKLLLATALLAATGVAQDPGPSPATRGPSTTGSSADGRAVPKSPPEKGAEANVDVKTWIQQLGSDSYRDRLEAENKLLELGDKARPALEAAADDGRDGEVQWRSKRVLRRLQKAGVTGDGKDDGAGKGMVDRRRARGDQQEPPTLRRRGQRDDRGRRRGVGSIQDEFDRMFERMEEDFGLDVPRRRFFDDRFFQDLRSQMREPPGAGARGSNSQGMNVQIGPDGVVVEVTETDKDGKPSTKKYEAPDMETFRKNYPDVLKGNGLSMGSSPFDVGNLRDSIRAPMRGFDWRLLRPRVLDRKGQPGRPESGQPESGQSQRWLDPRGGVRTVPGATPPAAPPAGERLGIAIQPIPDALRDYLELDANTGLMVGAVQAGTLAEALGLKPGDIVTKIQRDAIGGAPDVRKALAKVKKGEVVKVTFVRRGRQLQAETKKRHDKGAGRVELEPNSTKKARESIR